MKQQHTVQNPTGDTEVLEITSLTTKAFYNLQINASYILSLSEMKSSKGLILTAPSTCVSGQFVTLSSSLITRCMSGRVCFHISCALCYTSLPVNHLIPTGSGESSHRKKKCSLKACHLTHCSVRSMSSHILCLCELTQQFKTTIRAETQ